MRQIDFFADNRAEKPIPQTPDADNVRARLSSVLQQLSDADHMPLTPAQVRSWKHVFHNMANWLPSEERDKLRREFTKEIERLERA